jgi:thiol-disulfide isomerase/thioredoxin
MSRSTRWTVAVLIVVAAVVVALVAQLRHTSSTGTPRSPTTAEPGGPGGPGPGPGPAELAELRRRADLPPCPPAGQNPGPGALHAVTVQCMADGSPVDTARSVAGHAVLLNLWAYWCGPCAVELPAMAEYQRRAGTAITVITVHQDNDGAAALARLAELGVRLPSWQDGGRRVAAALHVPNVMPATVVLRPDGTVAQILPRAFADADEIAAAVGS